MTSRERDELRFRAALSRFGVGMLALALLPAFYPRTRAHIWIWAAYLAIAAVEQVLIRRHIGGRVRAFASGLVDTAMITYAVHGLGSVMTPMSSVYFLVVMANALVVERRVAYALAAINVLAFDLTVWAEWLGLLPFAPEVPELEAFGRPSLERTLTASLLVTTFVPVFAAIVSALVAAVQRRESLLVAANARLEELSQLDPLTNLYNRRHLFSRLETELARVGRGHPLALVMLDLDRFKRVNDSLGHQRGDELLKEIAEAVRRTIRQVDVAGRYGGDEFLVILPDTEFEQARVVAERVAASIREAGRRFDPAHPVTASVGIAVAAPPRPPESAAALVRLADERAYRAKESGGDCVAA
jgi:diguanylate cyclase (GGDEF)-like protein